MLHISGSVYFHRERVREDLRNTEKEYSTKREREKERDRAKKIRESRE